MSAMSSSKQAVRDHMWRHLQDAGVARFPFPLQHRIPNFANAGAAAERLAQEACYRGARVLKCNPDSPQRPVRERALRDGKVIYMAVPRLRHERCFLRLHPATLDAHDIRKAATISGATTFGTAVTPQELPHIDLIVAGSVAVRTDGTRLGKGGGYSDLEFAIVTELGRVDETTVIVTTVHDEQVVEDVWPPAPYDIPLDRIVTPTRTIVCENRHARPTGILWDALQPAMRRDVPVLETLRPDV